MPRSGSVLTTLFPHSICLREYLIRLVGEEVAGSLTLENDREGDFRELLDNVDIVDDNLLDKSGKFDELTFSQYHPGQSAHSVREIINRAIPFLLTMNKTSSAVSDNASINTGSKKDFATQNCVTFGYCQKKQSSQVLMRNHFNIECYFVNTIHQLFQSPSWQKLISKLGAENDVIGEQLFRHLLTKRMFIRSKNGSYMQISGNLMSHSALSSASIITELSTAAETKISAIDQCDTNPPLPVTNTTSICPIHSNFKRKLSRTITGSSTVTRHYMLYNTRKEVSLVGLAKQHPFFTQSPESIVQSYLLKDYKEKDSVCSNNIDLILLHSILTTLMKNSIEKVKLYQYDQSIEKFCQGNILDKGKQESSSWEGTKKGSRKRGCRAGKHVQIRKRQRAIAIEEIIVYKDNRESVQPSPMNTFYSMITAGSKTGQLSSASIHPIDLHDTSSASLNRVLLGDKIVKSMAHNIDNDKSYGNQTNKEMLYSQDHNPTLGSSNRQKQSPVQSKSSRRRIRKKIKELLYSKDKPTTILFVTDNSDSTKDSTSHVELQKSDTKVSRGLDCHVNRSFLTHESVSTNQAKPSSNSSSSNSEEIWTKACPTSQVEQFVQSVCLFVFGVDNIWGTKYNQNIFMRNVSIYLRQNRQETLNSSQLINNIRTNDIPWLKEYKRKVEQSPHIMEEHGAYILQALLYFIFNEFINSLVANFFYVTEVEGKGLELFYFRKKVWYQIVREHIHDFKQQFVPVYLPDPTESAKGIGSTNSPIRSINNISSSLPTSKPSHTTQSLQRSVSEPVRKSATLAVANPNASVLFNARLSSVVSSPSNKTNSPQSNATSRPNTLSSSPHTISINMNRALLNKGIERKHEGSKVVSMKKYYNIPTIRFVPKKRTVRPIANLSNKSKKYPYKGNTNQQDIVVSNVMLYNCYYVLKAIYDVNPTLGGSAVFSADDIYKQLANYKAKHLKGTKFYVAVLDVEKCFDHVNGALVYDIVEKVLHTYTAHSAADELATDASYIYGNLTSNTVADEQVDPIIIHKYNISQPQSDNHSGGVSLLNKPFRYVSLQGSLVSFPEMGPVLSSYFPRSIIADFVVYNQITCQELLRLLKMHLFGHVVKMPVPYKPPSTQEQRERHDDRSPVATTSNHTQSNQMVIDESSYYYNQIRGIPQGSVLSALLCTYYYGYIEHKVFGSYSLLMEEEGNNQDPLGITQGKTSLLRCIDDYLIVSTDPNYVLKFLTTVFTTFAMDYNVHVNMSKVKANFPITLTAHPLNAKYVEAYRTDQVPQSSSSHHILPADVISWCGWLLDCRNKVNRLQVRPDFSRIMTQAYSTSSISQMSNLLKSTCNYIRAKTHILILDTKVMNNLDTIYANIIAVFVVAAYRMSIGIDKLLKFDKKGNKGSRSGYILRCIRGSIIYGARLIQTRSKKSLLGLGKGAMSKTKTQLLYQHLANPQRQSSSDHKFDRSKHSLAQQSRPSNGANRNGVQGSKNSEAYVLMKKALYLGWWAFAHTAAKYCCVNSFLKQRKVLAWLRKNEVEAMQTSQWTAEELAALQGACAFDPFP